MATYILGKRLQRNSEKASIMKYAEAEKEEIRRLNEQHGLQHRVDERNQGNGLINFPHRDRK